MLRIIISRMEAKDVEGIMSIFYIFCIICICICICIMGLFIRRMYVYLYIYKCVMV